MACNSSVKGTFIPSPHDRRRLAMEAMTTERTIRRAYLRPGSLREATLLRLRAAAERLGLPLPQQADAAKQEGADSCRGR